MALIYSIADFCGVNTPTVANCRLPAKEEHRNCREEFSQLVPAGLSAVLTK